MSNFEMGGDMNLAKNNSQGNDLIQNFSPSFLNNNNNQNVRYFQIIDSRVF